MAFLTLEHLTKAYTSKVAVDNVSLAIPEGMVYGLLGPNGAGKTSLIRMITRITLPDSGRILFRDEPLAAHHQALIGYMPEERGLYKKMPVGEQIVFLLQLKGVSGAEAGRLTDYWLERFELGAWKNRKVDELSKGMQQKVQFIATIAHKPPLLILDEPFTGLDPLNAQLIEHTISDLSKAGTTIVFSTHRMEQVETFCQSIALINNGSIVLEGDVKALRRSYRKNIYTLESDDDLTQLHMPEGVTKMSEEPGVIRVQLPKGMRTQDFVSYVNSRIEILRFELYLPGLREIFIETVGGHPDYVHTLAAQPQA